MVRTTIEVGKRLFNNGVILLPVAHDYFCDMVSRVVNTTFVSDINSLTDLHNHSRWVLSNLTSSLTHHLTTSCKVRKHGTLLYRPQTDFEIALSQSLWKIRLHPLTTSCKVRKHGTLLYRPQTDFEIALSQSLWKIRLHPNIHSEDHSKNKPEGITDGKLYLDHLNDQIHSHTKQVQDKDSESPFDCSKLDLNKEIEQVPECLWEAICK